jgi:hypothetical protein
MRPDAKALAVVTLIAASGGASGCGFEDPNSAALQRGALSLVYPQALHVIGALSEARLNRTIVPAPQASEVKGLFPLLKTTRMMQQLGDSLGGKPHPDGDMTFSLVLVEPMLWTRFYAHDGRLYVSVHVTGPAAGDLVLIATEAAAREIAEHRLTAERAEQMGLLRAYGDPVKIARFRTIIAAAANWGID